MTDSDSANDERSTEHEYRADGGVGATDASAATPQCEADDLPADRETYGGSRRMKQPGEAVGLDLDVDRRDYLKAVGAASVAGSLAGASSGTAAAQGDWESEAESRIEEHRKGDLEVVVQDEAGNPVSDVSVDVEMQRHDYTFGTAIHAEFLTQQSEWGDEIHTQEDQENYRERVEEYFNAVVFENYHKWGIWETDWENPDETAGNPPADEAVEWAVERDMDVRGHVCVWGNINAYAIPPDVVEAMGVDPNDQNIDFEHDDFTQADHDPDLIVERSLDQIERIIEYYGDDVMEWEVANEVLHEPDMIRAVEGNGYQDGSVDALTAEILGDWYEKAEEVASQYDMGIAVNDYNTLVGPYQGERDQYEQQIQYLVEDRGIDLDGIGFQCHFGNNQTLSPDQILAGIDQFADYGAGLRATEFDMFEGQWTEQEQGEYMHQFLKTWFSHPDTEHFLMWNIWDPLHWGDELNEEKDAPLFREDWSEKPAFHSYNDLVFGEWWTEESGTTDASGTVSVSAFLGEHEVTVDTEEETVSETVEVTDADGTTQLSVTVPGGEDPCGEGAESMEVDGQRVCNVDGDAYYRDVNGDGSVGNRDVGAFFENFHFDAFDRDEFDYSGNGRVSHGDVVALFDYV